MDNNRNNNNNQAPKGGFYGFLLLLVLAFFLMSFLFRSITQPAAAEIPYSEFVQRLEDGKVESAVITGSQVQITEKEEETEDNRGDMADLLLGNYGMQGGKSFYAIKAEDDDTLSKRLLEQDVEFSYREDTSGFWVNMLITVILPIGLMVLVFGLLFRKMGGSGGPMGVGKSNAKVYVQKETGVTFKDVAGEDEAKESLQEVVDFLHNPGRYVKIGAKLPKGALLVGPPGTGKTLLAKAVAGEAHVPFFSLTGSDFIELYVGVGASRVRDLFKEATKNAPCIIFIDEIDAIGRSRDSKYGGGNEEREQTLNQLLSEMDGFDSSKGILILGATNRPEILDKALLRPGRFDRRIIVDKPDLRGRVEILKVHAKDVLMDDSVDLDAIALATSGAVGSDLANMINEAAINAVKEGRNAVCQKDLFEAVEQVLVGKEKKDRIMSKEERKIVSYHEVGHALIAALQKNSEPVQKITIVPRTMGALGYVMHVPEEEKFLDTEPELRARLVSLVGGRAAEEVVFGIVTTGAANDIEQATNIARAMITRFGMSKKFGMVGLETVESQYLEGRSVMNCSDKTAAEVDEEVMKLLKDSYKEAKKLLKENRRLMDKLAAYLIEKETITGKEFMAIFRKEKGLPEPDEKDGKKTAADRVQDSMDKAMAATKEAEAKKTAKGAEPPAQAGTPVLTAEDRSTEAGTCKATTPQTMPEPRSMTFEEAAAAYAPQAFMDLTQEPDAEKKAAEEAENEETVTAALTETAETVPAESVVPMAPDKTTGWISPEEETKGIVGETAEEQSVKDEVRAQDETSAKQEIPAQTGLFSGVTITDEDEN